MFGEKSMASKAYEGTGVGILEKTSIRQVERQLFILFLLDCYRDGISAAELHQKLLDEGIEVSLRTVRRDLDDLTLANFPIFEERKGKVTLYKIKQFHLPSIHFTVNELLGLYFLKELLIPVSSLPVMRHAYKFISQAIEGLPRLKKKFIHNLKEHCKVECMLMDTEENVSQEMLELLNRAIFDSKVIQAHYYSFSSDSLSQREIEPYYIIIKNRHYYLVGYCRMRAEVRDFRISRFRQVTIKDECFSGKSTFSYEDYVRYSWGILKGGDIHELEVRFSPWIARFVKEYHHLKADSIEELPDGSLLFCRRVAGLEEVLPWVLSFGSSVEVLRPPELREAVIQHLQQMKSLYAL
jgi:proteasome accessory factor B